MWKSQAINLRSNLLRLVLGYSTRRRRRHARGARTTRHNLNRLTIPLFVVHNNLPGMCNATYTTTLQNASHSCNFSIDRNDSNTINIRGDCEEIETYPLRYRDKEFLCDRDKSRILLTTSTIRRGGIYVRHSFTGFKDSHCNTNRHFSLHNMYASSYLTKNRYHSGTTNVRQDSSQNKATPPMGKAPNAKSEL